MVNIRTLFSVIVVLLFFKVTKSQEKKSTAASNVTILKKEFIIENLNSISHKVWLYLPPNYTSSKKKFSVIYMHDAQNVFDSKTSYAGEWKVDEQLNEIFKKTGKGFIVVAIENGGAERINEYTPWTHEKYGGGKGEIYINFIVKTLKPYIDSNYRTKNKAKHTALIGSSLGGLISYYGGLKYPKTFGKIGALSTSFWFSNKVEEFTKENGDLKCQKMYLLVGGKEGENMESDSEKMKELLLETGYKKKNLTLKINPEGKHNEAFWSSEFTNVINWLYK
ncbi:alpha/beta hydrolase-fold protein [Lutibacter sp. TH_r2]|uniref:alpha/beta hydrolase n=1 Tax=Lutibacter sp. TH_r2 TaxID=3082083 RepID=UPI002952D01C|nr:alpha/beta hydrolase-fold protein [Lutibacter sp. TH_r2]MDV7186580.1 alpha/beta hydrolase-fold protein [Lutibacter sp. TH_r2]